MPAATRSLSTIPPSFFRSSVTAELAIFDNFCQQSQPGTKRSVKESFLRFLTINIRAYKCLYYGWNIYLSTDKDSYNKYTDNLFDYVEDSEDVGYSQDYKEDN